MYANVIVDADAPGLSQSFTYHVPDGMAVFVGACVAVPFGGREMVGYIVSLAESAPDVENIKDITTIIPSACSLNPSLLHLAYWISDHYTAPLAHSIRAIMPEVMSATISSTVRLLDPAKVSAASPNQQRLVSVLADMGGEADADTLRAKAKIDKFSPTLRQLKNRGVVEVIRALELPKARYHNVRGLAIIEDEQLSADDLVSRAPKQAAMLKELAGSENPIRQAELLKRVGSSSSPAQGLVKKGLAEKVNLRIRREPYKSGMANFPTDLKPTEAQENALRTISDGAPQTTLLYGITSSGKTEVYLRSIADVLESGKSCIALTPEISLTTHLMDAYVSRFGDQIAILHSKLSVGERHDEWRRIESGEARVVLGPRSAVFAPVQNLGLIVVDEEHEPSYKQENSPRYNARMTAEERARFEGASVILGSATPSVETYYRALAGDMKLAVLGKRIDDRPLPTVHSVDLREEYEQGRRNVFSEPLHEAIADRLNKKEQIILFVNRRGYASFILCRSCGYTAKCENCAVSLTYHFGAKMLRCHHCNASHPAPTVCPNCGGLHIRQFGIGTERVEEEVRKVFPDASVIRMDSDTTSRKGSHSRLLNTFREGKADILVGTQMVAKGLDFPNVTLVGVISADTTLNLPDFRAAERTFQLLTQVSGRAGRGQIPGEVVVQSFSPEHYAVQAASRQDYVGFYNQEIEYRRELSYPPFSRLVNIVSTDPIDSYAEERLNEFAEVLRERISDDLIEILGPAPAPISKLKGLYRRHLLIKDRRQGDGLSSVVRDALENMPSDTRAGLTLDVDPQTML